MKEILTGDFVRLSAVDPEELGKSYTTWRHDSELMRLLDPRGSAQLSIKANRQMFEKILEEEPAAHHYFSIRSRESDRLLGDINLDVINWGARDSFVGIGINEREFWGRGYGTDAMKIILRFAFTEVNLRRVTLSVFEYNPRAVRSYEKAGFQHEGCLRGALLREGKRWDMLYMSILQNEWKDKYEH